MKQAKKPYIYLALLLAVIALVAAVYLCTHKDMTGIPYSEIDAYRQEHPHVKISYTVTIEGGSEPMLLNESTTEIAVTDTAQLNSLIDHADYLQQVILIDLGSLSPDAVLLDNFRTAFPNADVHYSSVTLLGTVYSADVTALDLSHITPEQVGAAACALKALSAVQTVELMDADQNTALAIEDVAKLNAARPDIQFHYEFRLFGKTLSTDMERLEYFKAKLTDEDLEQFRIIAPFMHNLTYLKLDWCGTSDEATAALREDLKEYGIKVVWRVFFYKYNCLTDTLRIWANWEVTSEHAEVLKYCNEVKYLDMGHSFIKTCEFVKYMPDLEVCILADTKLINVEPLQYCKNLKFVEIFMTHVTDLSPLVGLDKLEHLNISEMFALEDISPICGADVFPNLIQINCVCTELPADQVALFKENHPNSANEFRNFGHSTLFNWRYDINGHILPRYKLLREQIGYTAGYSRYPHDYVPVITVTEY